MARSRNIKPSIMANEELAELEPLSRLLFIYLWMLADRAGRLEDRPKRIAAQALPYDRAADVDAILNDLQRGGFIVRYTANDTACIEICAFAKHQNPHVRESESELPGQGTTKEVTEHNLGSAEASPRSPDSLLLIPDSLIHSVAKATGDKSPLTPDEIIFTYGVPLLTSAGTPEKQARSFLGGLRKNHGDEAVVNTLRECIKAKPMQPLEWLAKAMLPDATGQPPETKYQKAKRAQMERDFPNISNRGELKNGIALTLG